MPKFMYPRLSRSEIVKVLSEPQIAAISDPIPTSALGLHYRNCLRTQKLHLDSVRVMKLYDKIKEAVNPMDCPKRFIHTDRIRRCGMSRYFWTINVKNGKKIYPSWEERWKPLMNQEKGSYLFSIKQTLKVSHSKNSENLGMTVIADLYNKVNNIASRITTEEESTAAEQHRLVSRCEVFVKEFHEYKKSLPIL